MGGCDNLHSTDSTAKLKQTTQGNKIFTSEITVKLNLKAAALLDTHV